MKIQVNKMTDDQLNYTTAVALDHEIARIESQGHVGFQIYDCGDTHSIPNYLETLPDHPLIEKIIQRYAVITKKSVIIEFIKQRFGLEIDIPKEV